MRFVSTFILALCFATSIYGQVLSNSVSASLAVGTTPYSGGATIGMGVQYNHGISNRFILSGAFGFNYGLWHWDGRIITWTSSSSFNQVGELHSIKQIHNHLDLQLKYRFTKPNSRYELILGAGPGVSTINVRYPENIFLSSSGFQNSENRDENHVLGTFVVSLENIIKIDHRWGVILACQYRNSPFDHAKIQITQNYEDETGTTTLSSQSEIFDMAVFNVGGRYSF